MTPSAPIRVRHESRRRILTVRQVFPITPGMIRINFSADLADFVSAAADDHVKLFFFPEDLMSPDAEGQFERAIARDFTPRRFNRDLGELTIDFALHDEGAAVIWARRAEIGQRIGLGGPRSSFVVASCYDWYILVGDEAALPAIGRRLEELPGGTKRWPLSRSMVPVKNNNLRRTPISKQYGSTGRSEMAAIHPGCSIP